MDNGTMLMKMKEVAARIIQNIDKHGHTLIRVPSDDTQNGFMYTIGLTEAHLPEVTVSGTRHELGQVINVIAARWRE